MCKLVRAGLGLSAFGVNVLDLGSGPGDDRSHGGRLGAGGALPRAPAAPPRCWWGSPARSSASSWCPRSWRGWRPRSAASSTLGPDGARLLIVGGVPGKAYEPQDLVGRRQQPSPADRSSGGGLRRPSWSRGAAIEHDARDDDPDAGEEQREKSANGMNRAMPSMSAHQPSLRYPTVNTSSAPRPRASSGREQLLNAIHVLASSAVSACSVAGR